MALSAALVGFGQVAEKAHAPPLSRSKDFSVVAVADEDPERLALAAAAFPSAHTYGSLESLLRGEPHLDVIDIATPPFLHAKQVVAALQHRCHVLCEKPLTFNLKDFESIRAQAHAQERTVFTVHNWKYSPLFLKVLELADAGEIGAINHVELHTLRNQPASNAPGAAGTWRTNRVMSGGGILIDHGWHNFYLLQSLLKQEPRMLSARLDVPSYGGVEEQATCFIEYPAATALVHLTWHAPYRSNWGVVYGAQGTIEMRDDHLLVARAGREPERFQFPEKISQGSAHPDWFATMLEDLRDEIQKPRLRNRNLREAEACLTLLSHVYQSHRLGGKSIVLPTSGLSRGEAAKA
ncbi:MAG: Gfo/Idh/MocA family oxidoreductase [Elusimicrobia bacterium]|nr:Gfo/Idh/MocA family oxidoreductase [Elusimicrobiota bacterium]